MLDAHQVPHDRVRTVKHSADNANEDHAHEDGRPALLRQVVHCHDARAGGHVEGGHKQRTHHVDGQTGDRLALRH